MLLDRCLAPDPARGLLDAEVLAEVYVVRVRTAPLSPRISDAEREAHLAFVATLGEKASWNEHLAAWTCEADNAIGARLDGPGPCSRRYRRNS